MEVVHVILMSRYCTVFTNCACLSIELQDMWTTILSSSIYRLVTRQCGFYNGQRETERERERVSE